MTDPLDRTVRGIIALGILGCILAATLARPVPLPRAAQSVWIKAAEGQIQREHTASQTFAIDTITLGTLAAPYTSGQLPVFRNTPVTVTGWAFDPASKRTADHFVFRIDGGAWQAGSYHLMRPDVAAALNLPDVAESGFRVSIATAQLRTGPHVVAFATRVDNEPPRDLTEPLRLIVRNP